MPVLHPLSLRPNRRGPAMAAGEVLALTISGRALMPPRPAQVTDALWPLNCVPVPVADSRGIQAPGSEDIVIGQTSGIAFGWQASDQQATPSNTERRMP